MKYNGFYFWMFKSPMKKVLAEKYGREYAADIMKKSKKVYRELVEKADDIGDDNPMAYNELFALAFVAPYVASEKKIPPETVQEMMRCSLYHIKWYFGRTDLNTDKGKTENKKSVVKYYKWYTPEKEKQYPTSFKVDFVGQPHEGACYYRITRCPICIYTEKLGVSELMPLFCELDEVMITLQHGVLHRKQTLANGGEYCDYFITETENKRRSSYRSIADTSFFSYFLDCVSSDLPPGGLLPLHHEAAVESVNSNQLVMCTLLNDLTVIDNEYFVGVAHSFQPVSDHDDRLIVGQFRNGLHQLLFIFGVNIGRGLVQNDDGCVLHNGPGNGDALPLAAGERCTALTDNSVKAVR